MRSWPLEDNLGVVNLELRPDELAKLDELTNPIPIYPNYFNERVLDEPVRQALAARR